MSGHVTDAPTPPAGPISLVGAAAYLGMSPNLLRYHLTAAGHPPKVEGGRAYLAITLEEAERILGERRRAVAELGELPGWSAAHVARALGIRQRTVYLLRQIGSLPSTWEVEAAGRRKWRWDPETVRAYAKRVGRTLAE